jgi:hypothetical protein
LRPGKKTGKKKVNERAGIFLLCPFALSFLEKSSSSRENITHTEFMCVSPERYRPLSKTPGKPGKRANDAKAQQELGFLRSLLHGCFARSFENGQTTPQKTKHLAMKIAESIFP